MNWILVVSVVSGWHGTLHYSESKPMSLIQCQAVAASAKVQKTQDSDTTAVIYCKRV